MWTNERSCHKWIYIFHYITNDHYRYDYVYLMKYNSESFKRFKEFKNKVEKKIGKSIMILQSNLGGEYFS